MKSGFVAILGRPNVGKSTLLNRLVGQKVAIVTPVAGTTRHRLLGVMHHPGGQAVFMDTPGRYPGRTRLGEMMKKAGEVAGAEADLRLHVVDGAEPIGPTDRELAQRLTAPAFLVVNRMDVVLPGVALAEYGALFPYQASFAISALTGQGVEELVQAILAMLPEGPPYFPEDMVTDRPEEFLIAELIREQVLLAVREEVPHQVAVEVERMEEKPDLLIIEAVLFVERDSQKGILIGKGGSMLKRIGIAARRQIQERFGTPVHLALQVKVKEGWRDRTGFLRQLGWPNDSR